MDKILPTRSSLPPFQEYIDEISSLWDSYWLTNMGVKHEQFKNELKNELDVDNLELFTNGHMSIELSLQALGLKAGDEVITTPFTFISTTNAIVRNGLKPVFCDINPYDFTIDVDKIESLITEKTKAIMAVHVYGNICDVERIQEIADKYGLYVLYDSAHAFFETYKGQNIASFGDVSCFSFHATKVFHTIEGGCAVFKNPDLNKKYYSLKDFGLCTENEDILCPGTNAKMNEFCAAMGLCNLRHIREEIAKRKVCHELYMQLLSGTNGVIFPKRKETVVYNYTYFPICIDSKLYGEDRNSLIDRLKSENIIARKYFYPLTNEAKYFDNINASIQTPVAFEISRNIMTLPLFAELQESDIRRICKIIKKY